MDTNLTDVLTFIADKASADDLERIWNAARDRQKTLRAIRAAAVQVGQDVVLDGLSPQTLNGLTGTVLSIAKSSGQVRLGEASTRRLRAARLARVPVPDNVTEHVLNVPLSCCLPRDEQPTP